MKRFGAIIIFVLFALIPVRGQDNGCYSSTRAQGIEQMRLKQYSRAIEFFNAAEDCPDKPTNNDLRAKREECLREIQNEKQGYMRINSVSFANVDANGNEISGYGAELYKKNVKHISPKVYYEGVASQSNTVELSCKIIGPDGSLKNNSNSPVGYTWKESKTVYPGQSNSFTLLGWGNNTAGSYYSTGIYRFELWYKGNKLYSTSFEIKESPVSRLTVDGKTAVNTSFSYNGGTETFYVSTDADTWTTWGVPSWCKIEDKTSTSFKLRCTENTSSTEKKDYMKVKAGNMEVRIDITQSANQDNSLSKGVWRTLMKKTVDNVTNTYDNGVYKGQTSGGTRNGIGVYCWKNEGEFRWGYWSNGSKSDIGILFLGDGYTLKNCPDCKYYVGNWSNGEKNGTGTCYDKNGKLIYYGKFSSDKPTESYPTSGYESYKFECIEYTDGDMYLGETKNGKRHGYGIFLWSSGDAWFGPWDEGSRKGYGLYFRYSGSLLYGKWDGDDYTSY